MLFTLARREEVTGARWRGVDLQVGTWTIGAERVKNRQQHVVPLPRQAIDLLRSLMPADRDGDALIFAMSTGGPLANWDRITKRVGDYADRVEKLPRSGLVKLILRPRISAPTYHKVATCPVEARRRLVATNDLVKPKLENVT
jgi:integrase